LAVSLAQAVIILAFNENDDDTNEGEQQHKQFTYKELKEKTNIPDVELKRTLQSLYGGKYRVLLKTPMSKDIDEAKDAFKFNFNLQEKLVRLKISAIQSSTQASGKKRGAGGENGGDHPTTMEEDENEAVRESVRADRFHQIDAMIVRILKTRKKLPHPELINEVVAKLQFPVDNQDLKKRIESLIDREYVERDKDDRDVYHYVA
jgi:cullin-4